MLWDTQEQPCLGLARARRLRSRLNGPVWVETEHSDGLIRTAAIDDEGQLAATVEQRLAAHGELLIGQVPAGRRLDVLWIMGKVLGLRDGQQLVSPNDPQDRVAELDVVCARLAESLGTGCLSVALIDSPQGWQVLDFDLNPRLDHFIGDRDELLAAAVDLLGWLFPDGGQGRIPIIAVTGTNGKTTTCHMVEAILRQAGYRTGMATSLGSRVNGAWISQLEDGFLPGHLAILGHPEVDVAVLESTRGGARSVGLGFDHCTLSACLNVAAEHLNDELGLRSVDELAELKQWIALRAKKGVVFNYDNPYPRAMIDQAGDRPVTVVSLDRTAAELTETLPKVSALCTLEQHHGRSWLMVTDASGTRPIVAVEDIPMTLQGLARFNVSNAAHAVALGKALGVDEASIATGLRHLRPDFESLPGRLNLYQVGDFRVLYDYAHNPHGIAAVMEIVDRLPVRGCRRVNFSVTGTRFDDFAREVAALIAGHFDDYICTNYAAIYHRRPDEIPTILRAELLAQGIEADRIRTIENADDAIAASLASAQPGDLVVFLVGKTLRAQWKLIEAFGEISPVDPATIGSMPAPGQSA
ncbi:MAG: Mur ligase family protein [Wenzhouxiangella sp.]